MPIPALLDTSSDAELVAAAADVLAVPKAAPADSFVLHAPLELLARAELLRHVAPAGRDAARRRIVELVAAYQSAGDAVEQPAAVRFDSVADGGRALVHALAAGELDDVDAAAAWLGAHASVPELCRVLAPVAAASLAAA